MPGAASTSVHAVVHLSNRSFPVDLRIHTLLDGTPVLKRWLEIISTSNKPLALTTCIPWWPDSIPQFTEKAPIALGHSLRDETFWEGWFGWTNLKQGSNVFRQTKGMWTDDPYFFGQLAWPANYVMEFQRDEGLTFKSGPIAVNPLRVLSPGETITTPAVYLGYVRRNFDAAVQAM